jgi:tetratricopeptide (TPR) repeat protein
MNCYLKAMDVITNKKDYLLMGRISSDIGDIHIPQRDYALARKKYITAYDYFTKAGKRKFAFYELLVIGTSYNNAKQFKKAEIFYSRMLPKAKDSLERGDLYQAIGVNYYQYKKFDSALLYFRKCIRYPYFYNARAIRYYYYSDLLFDLHKFDSAFYYAKHSFDFEPDIRTQRECFRIMTNTEFVRGNLKNVSLYMNQYVTLNDSLRKIDSQTKGSYLEKMHSSALDAQQSGFQRWMLAGLLVFVVGAALILYFRMRKRNRIEKEKNEELLIRQKAGIRKELVHKHRDAMLHKIETIKAEQRASRKQATPAEKEELDRRLYEEVLHLNNADFFYREMDAVLNNLVGKLKSRYPSLTSKEITWCCLNLLHVPTADILLLLDYKVDSLNKMKQRLAQKVGVDGVTALDTFLNNLLTEE